MEKVEKKLREEAKKLLADKKVDVIVGYEAGTLPLTATPVFITTPEEADKLVWNAFCQHNLAKYVHDLISAHKDSQKRLKPDDRKRKVVGVVTKGCTSRSLVIHLQERQYERLDISILGVPCTGYVDRKALAAKLGGEDILEGSLDGANLKIKTASGDKTIPLKDVLAENCVTCRFNNPIISDAMMGEPAPAMNPAGEYAEIDEFEKLTPEERWAYFTKEMAKCIRCAACRQACPSCYCRTCFAEQSMPQWVGISEDPSDTQVFQFMRMYHMVGRCVDCGSCISVCPMGVDLRKFLKKLDKDCFVLFNQRAGEKIDFPAPLQDQRMDDKEEFIYSPGGGH